jgi:hypothetical protein
MIDYLREENRVLREQSQNFFGTFHELESPFSQYLCYSEHGTQRRAL